MAPKSKTIYVCSNCGYESAKWYGQCPSCFSWNTLQEELRTTANRSSASGKNLSQAKALSLKEIDYITEHRYATGIGELDLVLGGGLVKGSVVLLSGDPGIGKSTILLQICQTLGEKLRVLYISGEESAHQIKLRADRLGVTTENLTVLCETDTQVLCEYIRSAKPDTVIVDSIQTMNIQELQSSPGSVTQVRESTNLFVRTAKSLDIPIIIVGHVTKDGNIAGPKVLEHIVDTVLYFEGERNLSYRILRTEKNRFGSTNEIGVFEMTDRGLREVKNPSQMMIAGRPKNTSGTCIACVMEGSRPILSEVQGLVTPTGFGNPRRMTTGFDFGRLAMILAVLEKRCGYFFGTMDCYVNVVGGMKLDEPASDLTVAMALLSSLKDKVIKDDVIAFGEIGLAGEIRGVNACDQRVKEAIRLGFHTCVVPIHNARTLSNDLKKEIQIVGVRTIRKAFEAVTEEK